MFPERMSFPALIEALSKVDKASLEEASRLLQRSLRIYLVGNGGSAAIASHIANDLVKRGRSAMTFTDPPSLTCLANDLGWNNAYKEAFKAQNPSRYDTLVAISSSGQSQNILEVAKLATKLKCSILTLSGFSEFNPLRQMGGINFYVQSSSYGVVEITHLAILHNLVEDQ